MSNRERNDIRPTQYQCLRDVDGAAPNHPDGTDAEPVERGSAGQASDFVYLAHSETKAHPEGDPLKRHLKDVVQMAVSFFVPQRADGRLAPSPIDCALAEWVKPIALYHDAGKYQMAFQQLVRGASKARVDHSTLGGKLLAEQYGLKGRMMAFAVMGHHGGMPNGVRCRNGRSLEQRLADKPDEDAVAAFLQEMTPETAELMTLNMQYTKRSAGFELSMAMRMLFSALVDADYLQTERHFEPRQHALRGKRPDISTLSVQYDRHMARFAMKARGKRNATDLVIGIREGVRAACLAAGDLPQGFFSLTVPTGGGKTLASLGFALRHCKAHPRIRRIVYAIPFTSIIEQNAGVFREVFGERAVLEHHSAIRPPEDGSAGDRATENWDAPLIVTTNVQLFELLYANKPSRCRKLHNLRHSVIILDEAQALPDAMLRPCLMALMSLVKNHGATVLLCTATQPEWSAAWPEKPDIHEITPDVKALFASLQRTRTTFLGPMSDADLVREADGRGCALVIVNARAHAQALYRAFPNREGVYHLSALMCVEHRTRILRDVRARLDDPAKPRCILIATPLIEAGVDVDFPVVYRALAGLDSVAQAAGRCNRGGLLDGLGDVFVFVPESRWTMPPDVARQGQRALLVAGMHDDLLGKPALDAYFRLRFGLGEALDERQILRMLEEHRMDGLFAFEDIAASFEMIQSAGEPLVIPFDREARAIIERLKQPDRILSALRDASRFSINMYPNQRDALAHRRLIKRVGDVWVLDVSDEQFAQLYDSQCGLTVEKDAGLAKVFP